MRHMSNLLIVVAQALTGTVMQPHAHCRHGRGVRDRHDADSAKEHLISSTGCVPRWSKSALRGYAACVLVLAPELHMIALCTQFARSELGTIDSSNRLIVDELQEAVRASAAP